MSSKDENISYFVTFCVEQYKNAKCLKGEEALSLFDRYGVLDFFSGKLRGSPYPKLSVDS